MKADQGVKMLKVREEKFDQMSRVSGIKGEGIFAKLTQQDSWWNWTKLAEDRLGPSEEGLEEPNSSLVKKSLLFSQVGSLYLRHVSCLLLLNNQYLL